MTLFKLVALALFNWAIWALFVLGFLYCAARVAVYALGLS